MEWVMVPREPTDAMIQAGLNAPAYGHPETATPKLCDIYKAMLLAAPHQQAVATLKINEHGEYSLELPYSVDSEEAYAEFVNRLGGPGEYELCLMISPHPTMPQPETNLPISGLGGYDQVLRGEFEDGKK
jgi:hypothetical protein